MRDTEGERRERELLCERELARHGLTSASDAMALTSGFRGVNPYTGQEEAVMILPIVALTDSEYGRKRELGYAGIAPFIGMGKPIDVVLRAGRPSSVAAAPKSAAQG